MSFKEYRSLSHAIGIAFSFHHGQKRADGTDFIFHPLTVMLECKSYKAKIVAVLHDILEDTEFKAEHLEIIFGKEIRDLVELLTLKPNQLYMDYIAEVSKNPITREVKIADLTHNTSTLDNIKDPEKKERLTKKYREAFDYISKH